MFRIVIKSETASNKLMKNAALNFANYLNEIEAEEGYSKSTGKIMIGNEKAIDAQIGVSIESNFGVALESLVDSMPSHYRKNAGTIALGLTLNDQSLGQLLLKTINHFYSMAANSVSELQQAIPIGMDLTARQLDDKIIVEVKTGGMIDDMFSGVVSQLKKASTYSAVSNLNTFCGLNFLDLKDVTPDELL